MEFLEWIVKTAIVGLMGLVLAFPTAWFAMVVLNGMFAWAAPLSFWTWYAGTLVIESFLSTGSYLADFRRLVDES